MLLRNATALTICLAALVCDADTSLRIVAWNLEGNGSAARSYLTRVLEEKDGVHLWGLSEVKPSRASSYETAVGADEPGDFQSVLGSTGGNIRLQILFDKDKLELVSSHELISEFSALTGIDRQRAPLVGHFKGRSSGQEFLFVVNHLNRGDSALRHRQARALADWATTQTLPLLVCGDMNFDYDVLTGDAGQRDRGYDNLTAGGDLVWLRPLSLVKTQSSRRFSTVLDFIFVANAPRGWSGESKILAREGDRVATNLGFRDTHLTVDHRPVSATLVLRRGSPDEDDRGLMRDDFSASAEGTDAEEDEDQGALTLAELSLQIEELRDLIHQMQQVQRMQQDGRQ